MTIPENAVEIQPGLWHELHSFTIGTVVRYNSRLYASENYCFYDKTNEVYREDEEGNVYLVPDDEVLPEERMYMQYCITPIIDVNVLNATFVSVPVDPSYEIVSKPSDSVVA